MFVIIVTWSLLLVAGTIASMKIVTMIMIYVQSVMLRSAILIPWKSVDWKKDRGWNK